MGAYETYGFACERMREIDKCISFYRSKIDELEDNRYNYEVQAKEAYEAMEKKKQIETYFINEKTNIE